MAATKEKQELDLYGVDPTHAMLREGYSTGEDFKKQGDTRVVKHLLFPVHVKSPSPMFPDAEVMQERLLRRGDKVTVQELGLIALEKGERLGAFYTDAELAAGLAGAQHQTVKVSSEQLDGEPVELNELGPDELVLYLEGNGEKPPTVQDVLDDVGDDKDLARRMIDAETRRSPDDPRTSLVSGLNRVIESD